MLLAKIARADDFNGSALDGGLGALSGNRSEIDGHRKRNPTTLCGIDDSLRDRMFGLTLKTGCDPQQPFLVDFGHGNDIRDAKPSLGQRAGLIEDDCLEIATALKG